MPVVSDERTHHAGKLVNPVFQSGVHIIFFHWINLVKFEINKTMKYIYLLLMSVLLLSCSSAHYCYIVRHADKLDKTPYSVLSPAGHARAGVLRDKLIDKKIDLIFATTFQRTQETAQPLAQSLNKTLLIYRNNAEDSIANVVKANRSKNMLLVGHSGNIPSIIEKITGKKISPIGEDQYDNLYVIKFKKQRTILIETKY
jgi:Fructose-2,6-bisphosphatase